MNNSIKISLIISAGLVLAVVLSKAIDYYMAYEITNVSNQQIESLNKQFNSLPIATTTTPAPIRYEKVWVPGKPLKECMKGSTELNESVNKCRNGYFKEIRTN